jgi:uncharacterized protein Yka (UPF0111/DUF47 family)
MFSIAKLLPREEKFYMFLKQLTAEGTLTAKNLKIMVESTDVATRERASATIVAGKADAKRISAAITRELCLTFITPFDREDIQDLAGELYKIPKTIDKVREFLTVHEMTDIVDLNAQVDLIQQEAEAMESLIGALIAGGKTKQIMQQAAVLDALENKGDEILSELMVKLLKGTQDVRQLILRKDLYTLLEKVIDRYRNAAETVLETALKHS